MHSTICQSLSSLYHLMSTPDIIYTGSMSRWEPNARGRLEQAALDLFIERGFDQTTVTEIAERAGLTERTFFRYFADKREVLFWGQERLRELYVRTIAAAPEGAAPIDAVAAALEAAVPVFHQRRALVRQRQAVIAATPDLQERELLKSATLADAMAAALRQRGVPDPTARLAADAGSLAFHSAFIRWASAPEAHDLSLLIREAFDQLKMMLAGT